MREIRVVAPTTLVLLNIVDGAVVMVENIVRHLSRRQNGHGSGTSGTDSGQITAPTRTIAQSIREACHEVQRPVFYAIAIIITAYMPIFTLQRVEGRLFCKELGMITRV